MFHALLDLALMFFAYFFLTIGPLLAAFAGWNILFGKDRDDGNPKFFVQLVLCILAALAIREYHKRAECEEFNYNGYASESQCLNEYEFIKLNPDAESRWD